MFGHMSRTFAIFAVLSVTCLVGGCTDEVEDTQKDVVSTKQPVENGELDPYMGEGVVQVYIWNGSGWGFCSGQVISRDTVLTAGHCFWNNGFNTAEPDAYVSIYFREADGTYVNLTPNGSNDWVLAEVFMRQAFIDGRTAGNATRGEDIAVVRMPNNMSNVSSGDVAALARYTSERPDWLFLFGYGYHTDSSWDKQLRSGLMEEPSWSSSNKTITTDYGTTDPHACMYDSGGPYKHQTLGFDSFSGVQFGVQSGAGGSDYCYEGHAVAAMVAYHDTWIEDIVEDGNGSCSRNTYVMFLDGWDYGTIHALLCW